MLQRNAAIIFTGIGEYSCTHVENGIVQIFWSLLVRDIGVAEGVNSARDGVELVEENKPVPVQI